MKNKDDSPQVFIPPPIFFAVIFLLSILVQKKLPLNNHFFTLTTPKIIGSIIVIISLLFSLIALVQFYKTNNTVITIKPATSLLTKGVYSVSRNPMYLSLLLIYIGSSLIIGNWWSFILFPLFFLILQGYVIKHEEKYLIRRFGQQYLDYKRETRRWI